MMKKCYRLAPALLLFASLGCKGSDSPPKVTAPDATNPSPNDVAIVSPLEKILSARDLAQAVLIGREVWKNADEDWPADAKYMVKWLADKSEIFIEDIQILEKTTTGLVLKDVASERGKRICLERPAIVQLAKSHSSRLGMVYYSGLLQENRQQYSIYAVKDTGTLIQKQKARFCGIVTGIYTFKNTGGGTTISPFLVGMFDLPTNHRPK